MTDIVVVGAGTAGLTAAIYCSRAGRSVTVIEKGMYGGQITVTPEISNYPALKSVSGYEFSTNLYEQAKDLGADIIFDDVEGIENENDKKIVVTKNGKLECRAVILATGARNRPLGVEGEDKFTGAGVSYCATCDGAFYKGKVTAVVGGGNTAFEDAAVLSGYCEKVYLIHRRDTFKAEQSAINTVMKMKNIEILTNTVVESLQGDKKLNKSVIKNVNTGEIRNIDIDGIFIAIGQIPDNYKFSPPIELDKDGYIIANESCRTNVEGIFAAGDGRTKLIRQLATAAGDGAVAGILASEYATRLIYS